MNITIPSFIRGNYIVRIYNPTTEMCQSYGVPVGSHIDIYSPSVLSDNFEVISGMPITKTFKSTHYTGTIWIFYHIDPIWKFNRELVLEYLKKKPLTASVKSFYWDQVLYHPERIHFEYIDGQVKMTLGPTFMISLDEFCQIMFFAKPNKQPSAVYHVACWQIQGSRSG